MGAALRAGLGALRPNGSEGSDQDALGWRWGVRTGGNRTGWSRWTAQGEATAHDTRGLTVKPRKVRPAAGGADGTEQGGFEGLGKSTQGWPRKVSQRSREVSEPRHRGQRPGRTRVAMTRADTRVGASGHVLGIVQNQPPSTGGSNRHSAHLRGRTRAQSALRGPA